jgi:predicted Zn-dependent protease
MNADSSPFPDSRAIDRIETIGTSLAPRQRDLRFGLDTSPRINAYARGRTVLVTKGAYLLAGNDDVLAGLLAHEVAHLLLGMRGPQSEFEADRLGVKLAAEAGFHPQGLRRFLVAFAQILLAHPEAAPASALAILRERIQRLT